ncbi:MAG: ferredoxin family protein [Dehalococcoidia bacterium]|nr:ferredoxin family protein [Dehalococcoidia bacterium]
MPVIFDENVCDGCGQCVESCPGNILLMDDTACLPTAAHEEECWYCGACVHGCPRGAVRLELPARFQV